ncbi:hypothetical protein [Pyxidicoccus xibeiensis]|uniref:hypothetical protein n=1 Tax=Pyxidicoccus xibeiensis TaxID=2906759 RepID=UPI0020A6FDC4|nr:hypothetical protein [Pyxidicoccus xibeiensis]MCP3140255.1 hypothetical protein [Pyxidicoccus xibeiensis]
MKRILLPLSCLLALSACWRNTREPDWNPSQDIPKGTLVRITLQDANNPGIISTFLVDPIANRILDRRDGKQAMQAAQEADSEKSVQAAAAVAPRTVSSTTIIDCPPAELTEEHCLVRASDPKHETTGDPNPIRDLKLRLERTEQFVKLYALKLLEAAHLSKVDIAVQVGQQRPR